MPDLLLELRSEEIPARMQRKAAGDLRQSVTDALVEAGLTYEGAREYWTPRRLTLDIRGVDARSKDTVEAQRAAHGREFKAIEGFLRGVGIASIEQAHVHKDAKKGDFYVAHMKKPGRPAEEIIAEALPNILEGFPWPKSMRWGPASAQAGSFRWVRPLQSILCTFGPETSEPVVVDFTVGGIASGNVTYGHRFHAPGAIKVRRFDDYAASLERAFVVIDAERRKDIIRTDADNLAFASGLEVVPDEALLEEVSGLVEWPVVLTGAFEEAFLEIPPEVIRLTIKTNQKCFVTRIAGETRLSTKFLLVSNIEASDGGAEIARGNGKVVRARLSDALYFWRTDQGDMPGWEELKPAATSLGLDLSKPLDQRMAKLDALGVTFHAKLGTQGERVRRIAALAGEIAPMVGADPALARRAALLAKADLTSEAVGEFPELQGLMGRYYAALQGEHPSVQAAIEEHWKPQGPGDAVPSDPVAAAVALADKLDTLVGFWAIDEKPTGSKDPYALRRAALGVIRIVLNAKLTTKFSSLLLHPLRLIRLSVNVAEQRALQKLAAAENISTAIRFQELAIEAKDLGDRFRFSPLPQPDETLLFDDLRTFFHDRLKVQLRESSARHDLVDAVLPENDDLLDITRRVEALGAFLATEDGRNLLAGTKRAANILAAEEKKGTRVAEAVDPSLFMDAEEGALQAAIDVADASVERSVAAEDYAGAMTALAALRGPVDAFFDKVLVNAEDEAVRANRLALLSRIRSATRRIADVSKIAG